MRRILNLGLGAALAALAARGLTSLPEHPVYGKPDRSNEPKFRLPPAPSGPVTDSTPEGKRAKRRRLAKERS